MDKMRIRKINADEVHEIEMALEEIEKEKGKIEGIAGLFSGGRTTDEEITLELFECRGITDALRDSAYLIAVAKDSIVRLVFEKGEGVTS